MSRPRFAGVAARNVAAVARGMSERDLQANVVELAHLLGWRHYHAFDSRRDPAGFPDLVLIREGRILFRELKTARGRIRAEQVEWLALLRSCGQDAGVWRPEQWLDGTIKRELTRERCGRHELWVPLTVRLAVSRAIDGVEPREDRILSELQAEAAIAALCPWLRSVLHSGEGSAAQPLADGNGLEDDRA